MGHKRPLGRVLLVFVTIGLLSAFSSFAKAGSGDEKIQSNVHILFDFSSSYFEKEYNKKNKEILKKTFNFVKILFKRIMKPVRIQVFPITEISNTSDIMCEQTFCKKSLFGKKKKGCKKEKYLDKWFPSCVRKIMAQKPVEATDITGAIDKSVRVARAQSPEGDQTIIILSDFIEWRGNLPTPKYKLNDFHILLVYRAHPRNELTKEWVLPDEEVKKYSNKLKSFGAEKVIYVPEEADFGVEGSAAGGIH